MKIIVNKIGSVAKNCKLKKIVTLSNKISCREGAVIAVEVLNNKKTYNRLELTSGRISNIRKGDRMIVALGSRRALKGFVGEIPKKLGVGDIINLLNLGGVAGICVSENLNAVGHAFKLKVLGAVVDAKNEAMNINSYKLFKAETKIKGKPKLILISGTCMNTGKTSVACEIIKTLTLKDKYICAAKVAGIAALKDTNSMKDYGAIKAVSIIDVGVCSTVGKKHLPVEITKGAINYLSKEKPDYIVIELGDGILGEYGVSKILQDKEIQKHTVLHIGCAHDPVGAVKLYEIAKQIKLPLQIISGPITDNSVGKDFVKKNLKVIGANALSQDGKELDDTLLRFIK